MLYADSTSQTHRLTLGGLAQRTISATKRYRGYIQQVDSPSDPEHEIALWLPTLARLSNDPGWILWVAPPFHLNPKELATSGISTQRLLTLTPNQPEQAFSLVLTALQCQQYSAVFWWTPSLSQSQRRELECAAQRGQSVGVILAQTRQNRPIVHSH